MTAAKVAIVTDSACDLADDELAAHGIAVVPLSVRFGETEFVDKVELTNDAFWERLSQGGDLPSTAAPSPGAFAAAYQKAKENGASGVVCLTLSSELSATYQAAVKGIDELDDGAFPVKVIDTRTCTVAEGLLVREAARQAAVGVGPDEIAESIEELKTRTRLFGTLDTLENLKKGGRIGAAGAFFASLLSVKPVITITDGEVKPESRQRTRRRSIEHLVSLVTKQAPVENLRVAHSNAPDIDVLVNLLNNAQADDIPVSKIGPIIGTHGGPRLLAVAFTVPGK